MSIINKKNTQRTLKCRMNGNLRSHTPENATQPIHTQDLRTVRNTSERDLARKKLKKEKITYMKRLYRRFRRKFSHANAVKFPDFYRKAYLQLK